MPTFSSPGIYTSEQALNSLPNVAGPLRPAFVGVAKKGPLNKAVFITSAQQAIDTFGEPFPESYLMYAVLAYLAEGNQCYIMRVAVECEEGQVSELSDICIDTSGAKGNGWGRIPVFTGIDFGKINLRAVTVDNPLVFHAASTDNITYHDANDSSTHGATSATLDITGTYTGSVDDSYVMIITSAPSISSGAPIDGAGYQVVRNSDGVIVSEGTLLVSGPNPDISDYISVGSGLTIRVHVTSGVLDVNDIFSFDAIPDNRSMTVAVDGVASATRTMASTTYTSVASFIAALDFTGDTYSIVAETLADGTVVPQLRTATAGERIQLTGSAAFALEVGSQQYAYDIPRAYLQGQTAGNHDITTQNNQVKISMIGEETTQTIAFSVPVGLAQTPELIASSIDLAGVSGGNTYWDSFALTVPGGNKLVTIVASADYQYNTMYMLASYSNIKTLRFATELGIPAPYQRAYRGFNDTRGVLPDAGTTTSTIPLSCETHPGSSQCSLDTAYYDNIVGWFVAPTPGTWTDTYKVSLVSYVEGLGNVAGRFKVVVFNGNTIVDTIDDVSFDLREDRYIANVVNPGSKYGGVNGNVFINWSDRPSYLGNDVSSPSYAPRVPSQFVTKEFVGATNGIPTDPAFSTYVDAAVIGNPSTSSGLYAFQNPEAIDINLLATPGFTTGAVIGTALQICQARGDVLYLVDSPFGLRPQQVVDWHNGMLQSDLSTVLDSSYGALYWSWLQVYDQYSASYIWVPPSGHIAAVFSRTAKRNDTWFPPAGTDNGVIQNVVDVEYSPTQGERDLLYGASNAVNPIVKFPNGGIVVWGQKTLQRASNPLDRVNVRMLLTAIKKNSTSILRAFVFQPNDTVLWSQALSVLNPYLSDVQGRRGLSAYKVVIDSTNNTPERIGRHELWVSMFLQPTSIVEIIALNIAVLPSGQSFFAEAVLAAGGITAPATSV